MTGTREPQQDGSIQAMLRDSGLEHPAELRSSLEELRALVPDRPPRPAPTSRRCWPPAPPDQAPRSPRRDSPHVTATTAMPVVASAPEPTDEALPAGVTSLAERRGRKRRLAIVGGAVVGAMTLGAGAVAASSEDFRESVNHTVGVIFQPSGGTPDVAPKPAKPSPRTSRRLPRPSNAAGRHQRRRLPMMRRRLPDPRRRSSRSPRATRLPVGPRRSPSDASPSGRSLPGVPGTPRHGAGTGIPTKPLPERHTPRSRRAPHAPCRHRPRPRAGPPVTCRVAVSLERL